MKTDADLIPIRFCQGTVDAHQVHIWWFTCMGCDDVHYILCNGVPE